MKPLVVDLYCGLGGWTEGLLAEGWRARGYDIEAHQYGDERYPGEFVQRDILEMHGSEVADADLIVSSSPCTKYSYMAMPWSRAKAQAAEIRADETGELLRELNALFDAQFRIQREASEAKGEHIPMVVENVRGAQPWVGQARGSFGSYYLWGDVPALLPSPAQLEAVKVGGMKWYHPSDPRHVKGQGFNTIADRQNREGTGPLNDGRKVPGFRFDGSGGSFQTASVEGMKNNDGSWFAKGPRGSVGASNNARDAIVAEGRKGAGAGAEWFDQNLCQLSSKSSARKAASAKIAKIPFALSSHIARVYMPQAVAA